MDQIENCKSWGAQLPSNEDIYDNGCAGECEYHSVCVIEMWIVNGRLPDVLPQNQQRRTRTRTLTCDCDEDIMGSGMVVLRYRLLVSYTQRMSELASLWNRNRGDQRARGWETEINILAGWISRITER